MADVDLSAYEGREQEYVKHFLLQKYLRDLGWKVGSAWDSIVYVDGFSGPWQTKRRDCSDSSFGTAIDVLRGVYLGLRERQKNVNVSAYLVERDKAAFDILKAYAETQNSNGFSVVPMCGEFVRKIPSIEEMISKGHSNPFKFVFLDPTGWADIPMDKLRPFLKNRSCEVLINLMTRHITRFLNEHDREDSYNALFGRLDVLKGLQSLKNASLRADAAVKEYCISLKRLCGFKFVSSAVICDPQKEEVRYHLVYATNHDKGVFVFKDAEIRAARLQDELRHEAKSLQDRNQLELGFQSVSPRSRIVHQLRSRYLAKARCKVLDILRQGSGRVSYRELFCEAMSYPLVTPQDLDRQLKDLIPNIQFDLGGSTSRKKPSPSEEDYIVVTNPSAIN